MEGRLLFLVVVVGLVFFAGLVHEVLGLLVQVRDALAVTE